MKERSQRVERANLDFQQVCSKLVGKGSAAYAGQDCPRLGSRCVALVTTDRTC